MKVTHSLDTEQQKNTAIIYYEEKLLNCLLYWDENPKTLPGPIYKKWFTLFSSFSLPNERFFRQPQTFFCISGTSLLSRRTSFGIPSSSLKRKCLQCSEHKSLGGKQWNAANFHYLQRWKYLQLWIFISSFSIFSTHPTNWSKPYLVSSLIALSLYVKCCR